jgi:hypothetical protein
VPPPPEPRRIHSQRQRDGADRPSPGTAASLWLTGFALCSAAIVRASSASSASRPATFFPSSWAIAKAGAGSAATLDGMPARTMTLVGIASES